jgi:hypothetical protein
MEDLTEIGISESKYESEIAFCCGSLTSVEDTEFFICDNCGKLIDSLTVLKIYLMNHQLRN